MTNTWQGPRPCTVWFNMNRAALLSIAVAQHGCSVTPVGLFKGSPHPLLSNTAWGKVSSIQRSKDLSDLLCLPSHLLSTVNNLTAAIMHSHAHRITHVTSIPYKQNTQVLQVYLYIDSVMNSTFAKGFKWGALKWNWDKTGKVYSWLKKVRS